MAWLLLTLAGVFEVTWAVALKYADGFSKPLPSVIMVASLAASMGLLALAVRTLPLGTAYTAWTGIGAVGSIILGMVLFKEPVTVARIICLGLIVAGILGLRLLTPPSP